jgi:hypothetical protein
MSKADQVTFLKVGALSMSVCVPASFSCEEVVEAVNMAHLCGTEHGWQISEDGFETGEPNGCTCERDDQRRHWFMEC